MPRPEPPPAAPRRRRTRVADLAVTAVLLLGLTALVAYGSLLGALAAGVTDDGRACAARCVTRVDLGSRVGADGPWAWWWVTLAVVGVRAARRRTTWWVPLAAAPLVALTVVAASAYAHSGPSG